MPKEPMKNRVVRVPDHIWDAANARADKDGDTVSDAIRRFLKRYGRPTPPHGPQRLCLVVPTFAGAAAGATLQQIADVHAQAVRVAADAGRVTHGDLHYDGEIPAPAGYEGIEGAHFHQYSIETI